VTGSTESCVNQCHGWSIWPLTIRLCDGSTARKDAASQPSVMSVTVPSGATSFTRTLTTASCEVVVTQRSANTGPEKRRSCESGCVV
jgi:hypothetical protein